MAAITHAFIQYSTDLKRLITSDEESPFTQPQSSLSFSTYPDAA